MRKGLCGAVIAVAVLCSVMPSWADGQADALAIIDQAIKARGGEEKLARFKAFTSKSKGTIHRMGLTIPFTGEDSSQLPERVRSNIHAEVMGQEFEIVVVINGDKGWRKLGENDMELEGDQLKEAKEGLYADWVTTLLPLKDKAFTLTALGDSKVEDKAVVGVKVAHKDHRDVRLFFDKQTHLLVKSERRVKDAQTGQEMDGEAAYSDYKEVEGVKFPMKTVSKRDGQPASEVERSNLKPVEKLDDKLFEKP